MKVIVEHINFTTGSTGILVQGDINPAERDHLVEYINTCKSIGINDVGICYYTEGTSVRSFKVLKKIARETGAIVTCQKEIDEFKPGIEKLSRFEFRKVSDPKPDDSYSTEYCMNFTNLNKAVEEINTSVALIGCVLNLENGTLARLQLCVYELAINSVEHGTFPSDPPMIILAISSNNSHVSVCYKDNASIFLTKTDDPVSINEQIKYKRTRGLGLYIMNRLSQDFCYKRLGPWNVTIFKIAKEESSASLKKRSLGMKPFSIKLVDCDIENAMIAKVIGSIDSSSAQNIEEHFNKMLNDGTRYIIIDFSEVSFISSAGIGIMLGAVSSLREQGGDMIFLKVPNQIREIFDILNINDYFVSVDSIDALKDSIHS